jgi:anti-sigma factor RsiW
MVDHLAGELISAYVDGELSGAEKTRAEAHWETCASCRAEFEAFRKTKSWLSQAPRRSLPPGLIAGMEVRLLRPSWAGRFKSWFALPQVWIPSGAFAAAALVLGFWMGYQARVNQQALSLEALLAAHSRYVAEALVPHGGLAAANFSAQLAADNNEDQG